MKSAEHCRVKKSTDRRRTKPSEHCCRTYVFSLAVSPVCTASAAPSSLVTGDGGPTENGDRGSSWGLGW